MLVLQNVQVENCVGASGELDFLVVQTDRLPSAVSMSPSKNSKTVEKLTVTRVLGVLEVKKHAGDVLGAVFKQLRLLKFWHGKLPDITSPRTKGFVAKTTVTAYQTGRAVKLELHFPLALFQQLKNSNCEAGQGGSTGEEQKEREDEIPLYYITQIGNACGLASDAEQLLLYKVCCPCPFYFFLRCSIVELMLS